MKIKCLIISLIIAISMTGCDGGVSMKDEKVGMEKWLIEKYGKEFVVEDVKKYTPYLGATKVIEGIANPKDNEDIKFTISKYAHGGYTSNGMPYLETYNKILWEYQYKNQIKSIIDSEHIKVAISAPYTIIDKEINGKTLNLDDAKEIYTNSVSAYITYSMFSDLKERNEILEKDKERILLELEKLKDDKFKEITLKIVYFNNSFKSKINKNSPFKFYTDGTYQNLRKSRNILMEIEIKDINQISKTEDISKYIK